MNPIIIIPARMGATRLPGKPLVDINGLPMIVRVARCAEKAKIAPVYVACGDQEIFDRIEKENSIPVLTDPNLPSGTDRIHAALQKIDPEQKHDVVINVRGDIPDFDPSILSQLLVPFKDNNTDISTPVSKIIDKSEEENPNVVKAVISFRQDSKYARALYFTRTKSPYGDGPLFHHIGIYAYRRKALERFVKLAQTDLEKRERLEQLRAMEDGLQIQAVIVDSIPQSIDTAEDLAKARKTIK